MPASLPFKRMSRPRWIHWRLVHPEQPFVDVVADVVVERRRVVADDEHDDADLLFGMNETCEWNRAGRRRGKVMRWPRYEAVCRPMP
jgi:hypothetical protein